MKVRWILTAGVLAALTADVAPAGEIGARGATDGTAPAQMGTDFARRTGRLGFGNDPRALPGTDFFGASGLGRSRGDILNPVDEGLAPRTSVAPFPKVTPTAPVRPQRRENGFGLTPPAGRAAFE